MYISLELAREFCYDTAMIRSLLNFVGREIRGLHTAAYLLGAFTIFSATLALVRDHLLASAFGAGPLLDMYYAAFRIPDLIYVTVASLISAVVLVPALSDNRPREMHARLISGAMVVLGFAVVVISVLLFILMPSLLTRIFPTLIAGEYGSSLVPFSRILLIQPLLLGLSGILISVAQVNARYVIYAIAPILYNIGIILGIVLLYPLMGLNGLVWGVVLGALLHLLVQIPFSLRQRYLVCTRNAMPWRELWRMARDSIPRTISLSINKIMLLVFVAMGATLGVGAVSVFNFSFNLQAAPLAIIGASYSVAAFPVLARLFANKEIDEFVEHVFVAARHIFLWTLPLTTLFIVLRAHIVRIVLGAGAFDWNDTRLTAAALALFIISLVSQALVLLFTRSYYAAGQTRKPLLINVGSGVVGIGLAFALIHLFGDVSLWRFFIESLLRVENVPSAAVLMLPLAFALSSLLNAAIFAVCFAHDFNHEFSRNIIRPFFDHSAAAIVGAFAAYNVLQLTRDVFDLDTALEVLWQAVLAGGLGVIATVVVLLALKNREIREVLNALASILTRTFKRTA